MLFDKTWHQIPPMSDISATNIFVNQLHVNFFLNGARLFKS